MAHIGGLLEKEGERAEKGAEKGSETRLGDKSGVKLGHVFFRAQV